jgi:nucleoid DNA-binding protein
MAENDNKYSKSDLINVVTDKTGYAKKEVKNVVDTLFTEIADVVADGGVVTIQGFARFFTKEAQPRSFRKIHSDEIVQVGARQLPKTKFSRNLTNRVKN